MVAAPSTARHSWRSPEAREAEVLGFIRRGLADISISRDATRSQGWGIPYPGDPGQVVYVWIDALVNYLSGRADSSDDAVRWWDAAEKCHVIGKNVWKFHAVYWPALLLSAGLPLPRRILVHGFLTNEGRKISKSTGDAVDPIEYIEAFGTDGVGSCGTRSRVSTASWVKRAPGRTSRTVESTGHGEPWNRWPPGSGPSRIGFRRSCRGPRARFATRCPHERSVDPSLCFPDGTV